MGLLIRSAPVPVQNFSQNDPRAWLEWAGVESDSGAVINRNTAMQMAVIWQCVSWRAKMYGHLPHKLYENVTMFGKDAQQEARNNPLWSIIHDAPNPTLTSTAWHGLISVDHHLDGNHYGWIERGSNTGRIQNIWRFMPDMMRIDTTAGRKDFYARRADGTEQKFLADEILHIPGLGYDGVRGYNPIHLMRNELGWAAATRQFSSKYYKNAFRPSGILTTPQALKEPAKTQLLEALRASGKDGGLALIEGAMDYKPMFINQDDAQFLETMQFQDDRLAGIMEVYPHEIGIMREMTNNNVEQMTISSVTRNLLPFSVNVEDWMNLQLLSDAPSSGRGGGTERKRFFIRSNFNALLRGDSAAQTALLTAMLDRGVFCGNDAAAYLGNPPYEGGDVRFINRAFGPVDMAYEWSKVSQNNPPAATPEEESKPEEKPKKKAEVDRVVVAMFKGGVGRALARKGDRAKSIAAVFGEFLEALGMDAEFSADYLSAMAKRSESWTEPEAGSIAESEVNRALEALEGRK
jgi:HK97 family phage portal protein